MAVIAQNFAKVTGFTLLQTLVGNIAASMGKHTVPHWVDYLNDK
ncbi:hypothetical protein [Cognatishimia activa]|nr:hypothetical protein [Cognatishimia activa]